MNDTNVNGGTSRTPSHIACHTKRLAFDAGLRQCCTGIVRFSHGASSGHKVDRSSFIPGLHDVCVVFEKPRGEARR